MIVIAVPHARAAIFHARAAPSRAYTKSAAAASKTATAVGGAIEGRLGTQRVSSSESVSQPTSTTDALAAAIAAHARATARDLRATSDIALGLLHAERHATRRARRGNHAARARAARKACDALRILRLPGGRAGAPPAAAPAC